MTNINEVMERLERGARGERLDRIYGAGRAAELRHATDLKALLSYTKQCREALEPFAGLDVIEPNGVIIGLERWHFERARQALSTQPGERE